MLRTHTCGQLRLPDANTTATLCGWVQTVRDKGGVLWIDLRDRYGITQILLEDGQTSPDLFAIARSLGREFVLQATGTVIERKSKNPNLPTGDIEIKITALTVLNPAKTPPFLIDDETDGGDDLRLKYRYLDLRRNPVRRNLELRHRMAQQTRLYMDGQDFIEVETPVLIKSTPEGARDFVVPSRMNPGEFYALPQSPQTFKQLLMVSGFDRYYQIVKCFRDEDLRADRQPEFTQIDCEMSFVEQEDILNMFEGLVRHLFKAVKGIDLAEVPRMTYDDAMRRYGSDKPDTRFGMEFVELTDLAQGKGFPVFDSAELVVGINAPGCAGYTRKQLDELTEWLKRPQIGAKGLIYVRYNDDNTLKSSVDKFYSEADLKVWSERFNAKPGDLILIMSGETSKVRKQLNELRLEIAKRMFKKPNIVNRTNLSSSEPIYSVRFDGRKNVNATQIIDRLKQIDLLGSNLELLKYENQVPESILGGLTNVDLGSVKKIVTTTGKQNLRKRTHFFVFVQGPNAFKVADDVRKEIEALVNPLHPNNYSCLWVLDFPLLEYGEDDGRWYAMHHPFTSPKPEDMHLLNPDIFRDANPLARHDYADVRANAYDMVINGTEVGGGSIRIFNRALQARMFSILGFSDEEAKAQFGFLMDAFEYGAPPHGGIAFGFDRLCSLFGGADSIRDFIAFPKNNSGRDVMIDSPSAISAAQLAELNIATTVS